MINKELIELQKGCTATCVVILDEDSNALDSKVVINATAMDKDVLTIFKEKIATNEELDYIIISNIDMVNEEIQNKFYGIVKDREFYGYKLPSDTVIVLTVENREGLKNISPELYNLCVVSF